MSLFNNFYSRVIQMIVKLLEVARAIKAKYFPFFRLVVRIVHKIGEKNVFHAKLQLIAAPPIS